MTRKKGKYCPLCGDQLKNCYPSTGRKRCKSCAFSTDCGSASMREAAQR